ncbi:MAG TPA: cell division protein FtsA [Candidatus Limnocylindria bacterium]|jgi:cell division protein FtsA|nr:cell division protein FtsA [Candidatus Limnocylindria bacterium]
MFNSDNIVVGLEIGTHKICAAVGEANERGDFTLIGLGQAKSRGVRKGEINDLEKAQEDVRLALADAEEKADVTIRSVWLGVTGAHIASFNNRGMQPVASVDRLITQHDLGEATKNARAVTLPPEHTILHHCRQKIYVDGFEVNDTPVGHSGARIDVDVHFIHGNTLRMQNAERAVQSMELEVAGRVFTGLASAQAVLTGEYKRQGALMIDLGAGTTEYVLQEGAAIQHSGVLAVGGDHVTSDLAAGLDISLMRAEQIKKTHGHAMVDPECRGQMVPLGASEVGLPDRSVCLEHLRRIMSVRLEEIFELIAEDVDEAASLGLARAGVFLCGGGAQIPGIEELARRTFRLPVRIGNTQNISGNTVALGHPEFATAIGIARYGALKMKQEPKPVLGLKALSFLRR